MPRRVGGVLVVYARPISRFYSYASNVDENIAAFREHSRFPVYELNTELGWPRRLGDVRFDAIVMHYTLFAHAGPTYPVEHLLGPYLEASPDSYKVCFFQDEYHWWSTRSAFLDDYGVDCVYTLLEPPYAEQVYGAKSSASKIVSHLPGYVGRTLLEAAPRFERPEAERSIDVGYRGRPMPAYMGRASQEKREIGEEFARRAAGSGLALDIALGEKDRIYGDDWWRFTADSKATLGVESGVSCFDLEDEVRVEYERLAAGGREPTLEEMDAGALGRWDGKIPYRTISPRHFEAAALRVTQILFEGNYSGLMEPMRHYIPLAKDFSNFEQVLERLRDADLRHELTANAYDDLIASGANGYERFVESFDAVLAEAEVRPAAEGDAEAAVKALHLGPARRAGRRIYSNLSYHPVAKRMLWRVSRPVLGAYRRLRSRKAARA